MKKINKYMRNYFWIYLKLISITYELKLVDIIYIFKLMGNTYTVKLELLPTD